MSLKKEIESFITDVYKIDASEDTKKELLQCVKKLKSIIDHNSFLNSKNYRKEVSHIEELFEDLRGISFGNEENFTRLKIQKGLANLARTVYEENRKIFVVHGRNLTMRDRVCSTLGRLKLDYVILESESNSGTTIIEKFLKNAGDCGYAVVLFSADDVGKLDDDTVLQRPRPRQNVVLELGYFLGTIGRKNICILHEAGFDIEKPSDFDGIVYAPFDEYGAWKAKLIKEMKRSKIYIDPQLADRV